mgnify:FL=1
MSTYNGHEYIKEQIASILSQAYTDFTLFIRDDGSTDDTVLILQTLAITDSRIKLIIDEPGHPNNNLGFGESFSGAMQHAMSIGAFDYYAFCDQDDYWDENKIKRAVNSLDTCDQSLPTLYACNYYICDSKLTIISQGTSGSPMKNVTFENMFFEGVFPGFTIVINRTLAMIAFSKVDSAQIYYHDKWVSLITLGLDGKIIYDHTPLAKYRRHESVASSTGKGAFAKLKWRIDKVLNGDFCPRTRQMLHCYKDAFYRKMNYDIRDFLDVFTGTNRIKKLFFNKRLRRSISGEILLRFIILLGKI